MDGGGNNAAAETLYEMFFDLTENLCGRYAALTPFAVRREKFCEVVLLVNRINAKDAKKDRNGVKRQAGETVRRDRNGNIHIRRPATNDNWF